jgi:hypothetical protein
MEVLAELVSAKRRFISSRWRCGSLAESTAGTFATFGGSLGDLSVVEVLATRGPVGLDRAASGVMVAGSTAFVGDNPVLFAAFGLSGAFTQPSVANPMIATAASLCESFT